MSSTPPLIFKRTKSKPTQRARDTNAENNTDDNISVSGDDSPSTLVSKLKNKVKKARPKSRLSFGGEEEEEEEQLFQVKKSNLSRKLALGTHPAGMPARLDQPALSLNNGPRYDKAYLNDLKASTPTSRPPISATDDADIMDLGELSMQTVDFDMDEPSTFIPSESSIKVAKEKRERLRNIQVSGEDDFISLSVTRKLDEPQGPHPGSRLVREEDELGEGDDEFAEYTSAQERIALGKKSRKVEANKRRDAMKELIADAEEEDEETVEWEQEQLRRGGHRTPERPLTPKVKQTYKAAPIPSSISVPTLAPAIAHLTERLTQLRSSHANNVAALASLAQEQNDVDAREQEMRDMVEKAEDKRAWFDSFREWIEGVAGFLDEKYPVLEQLEVEFLALLQERFDLITQRRKLEDEDDLLIFLGSPSTSQEPKNERFDGLDRVVPKANEVTLRHARRVARNSRRQQRSKSDKTEDEEGYSTDSSLPPHDHLAYSDALKALGKRTEGVLSDVRAEEFRDPAKGRWSTWREKYTETYTGAWGGLGMVSAWEFWVRLEIIGWDCIEDARSLDSFKWYKGLYNYCRPVNGDNGLQENELGVDGDLVASMLSTAVIPRVCKIIQGGALNVYSGRHIRRMIHISEELESNIETGHAKFESLLKCVTTVFQAAIIDMEVLLTKYNQKGEVPGFSPESIPARRRFLARRVKLLQNLLRWRKYTGEKFGIGLLVRQLVETGILKIADGGWEVGGEHVVRLIASMLPPELLPSDLQRRFGVR